MSRVWLQVCERMREHVCVCACRDDVKCMRERSVNYLQDAAGSRNLVLDLSIAHDHYGSSTHPRHNGLLTHAHSAHSILPDTPVINIHSFTSGHNLNLRERERERERHKEL